jgi:hypothetical protein
MHICSDIPRSERSMLFSIFVFFFCKEKLSEIILGGGGIFNDMYCIDVSSNIIYNQGSVLELSF